MPKKDLPDLKTPLHAITYLFKNGRQQYLFIGILSLVLFFIYPYVDSYATPDLPKIEEPIVFYSTEGWKDLKRMYLKAIHEAKESIVLSIFTFTDRDLMQALKTKSEEGIKVTVLIDKGKMKKSIYQLGKKVKLVPIEAKTIMHQKLLVIDGKLSWIGSANFSPDAFSSHGNFAAGFHDENVAKFITNQLLDEKKGDPFASFKIRGQKLDISFQPEDKKAAERVKQLIASAKKTIFIAMYTWTRPDFRQEVLKARQRGVDVTIALDRSSSKGSSLKTYKWLKSRGIPVYRNKNPGLLHYKFLLVDGNILLQGSTNWTLAGFTENNECYMILYDLTESERKELEYIQHLILKGCAA